MQKCMIKPDFVLDAVFMIDTRRCKKVCCHLQNLEHFVRVLGNQGPVQDIDETFLTFHFVYRWKALSTLNNFY